MSAVRLSELYREHLPAVLAYATRRTTSLDDAADVAAETFLVASRRIDDVPDEGRARPWSFGVARKVLANQRRSEQRRTALAVRILDEFDEGLVVVEPHPLPNRIRVALQALKESDRELIMLIVWDDLDPADAALVLGITPATVRVRAHRARKRLRTALEAQRDTAAGGPGQPSRVRSETVSEVIP